jgi:radical SAM superfamily enzyme YgiQ (UPF0313 family)
MYPKIQLIRCPVDDPSIGADQWNMPLDLLSVCSDIYEDCYVEILDGTLLSIDEIYNKIDPLSSCVGFTYTALSSLSLKYLAETAKNNGSLVIIGGQPAIASAKSLIEEHCIDAVCIGDGEATMRSISCQLLYGDVDLRLVPNIIFKSEGRIVHTLVEDTDVWNKRYNDRTYGSLNPDKYFIKYPVTNTLLNMRGDRATNIYSKRGCYRYCSFCARQDKKFRLRNPEYVAEELRYLVDEYNVDYILDTSDTWVSDEWVNKFSIEKNKRNLNDLGLMVFADVRDITNKVSDNMKICGIDSVLLGVESGSEKILNRNNKRMTKIQIINAVENLVRNNIRVSCSFVLGQLDEDDDSICDTIELTEVLNQMTGVLCYGNVIIPLRGSQLWGEAFPSEKKWPTFITRAIDYNMDMVRQLYVSQNLKVSGGLKTLEDACKTILKAGNLSVKEYAR